MYSVILGIYRSKWQHQAQANGVKLRATYLANGVKLRATYLANSRLIESPRLLPWSPVVEARQRSPPAGGSTWTFVASSQWPVVDEATSPEVFRGAGRVASSTTAIRSTTPTKNREVPPRGGSSLSEGRAEPSGTLPLIERCEETLRVRGARPSQSEGGSSNY